MTLIRVLEESIDGRKVMLVYGKGGVGKTTFSLMVGLHMSAHGYKVLVVSLDPAKHLPNYVNCKCINRVYAVTDNLHVEQYDVTVDVKRLGEEYALLLRRVSTRLAALNLDKVLNVVTAAPGLEEEAYLRKLEALYNRSVEYDYVVIDMPPTGVALRIVKLPLLYNVWLEALEEIRFRLAEARAMLARVAGGDFSDPVLEKLKHLRNRFSKLHNAIIDGGITLHVGVATPEPLPVMEVEQVANALRQHGAWLGLAVLNRVLSLGEAKRLGIHRQQVEAFERLKKVAQRVLLIPYLGRPTKSLGDVQELLSLVKRLELGDILPQL
ncbi:arsenite efflux ATP-binding protein ArsA [Pyrolobus fumarii 1A]|uniref:Arsenite efflux ATP-binding protein ArsA n=1 Tax=Pyrolobus fumarii (strain DSM 11204 / 1A) TaxID=694429 RepID=G0EFB3_PYRF1|nr:arsenite efflux ATP-binding protein ArsA [Pyrolobus fumarii 1A]